jgi:hypothetical protein
MKVITVIQSVSLWSGPKQGASDSAQMSAQGNTKRTCNLGGKDNRVQYQTCITVVTDPDITSTDRGTTLVQLLGIKC